VGLHHPVQRRRREKKLLKIEDVNERFPVMTYKAWRAQRERAGLSPEGGIAPQTNTGTTVIDRPESEHKTGGSPTKEPHHSYSHEIAQDTSADRSSSPTSPSAEEKMKEIDYSVSLQPVPEESSVLVASSSKHRDSAFSVDADPDEEEDHSPIPNELLATSGDNCAICIELLEDDDEVRGLTCGHCYHQACLDPWLTQRRASCPLCKADYYIPRPPPPPQSLDTPTPPPTISETATPTTTQQTVTTEHWAPSFLRPFRPGGNSPRTLGSSYPFTRIDNRRRVAESTTTADAPTTNQPSSAPTSRRILGFSQSSLRNPFRRMRTRDNGDAAERGEAGQGTA